MVFFPMSCVLRGFSACDVRDVRLGGNPCAALLIEKKSSFMKRNLIFQDSQES